MLQLDEELDCVYELTVLNSKNNVNYRLNMLRIVIPKVLCLIGSCSVYGDQLGQV